MKYILAPRYLSLVASLFSFIGAGFLFYLGGHKTYKAIENFIQRTPPDHYAHLAEGEIALVGIVEAVDTFLFALVMLIFAVGIIRIFFLNTEESQESKRWWHVNTITELKAILLEIIIVMLAVLFLKSVLIDRLGWELLIIPTGALLLSAIYYILKKAGH